MEEYLFVENKINPINRSRVIVLDVAKLSEKPTGGIIIDQKNIQWVNNAFTATEPKFVKAISIESIEPHVDYKFTYNGISCTGKYLHLDNLANIEVMTFFANIENEYFNSIMFYIPVKKNGFKRKHNVELIQEKL